ncbi:hypothetical protein Tco_0093931 [Tanacetum coccineum]
MKWLPKLMKYDYEVMYKKGSENGAADALSRVGNSIELLSIFFKKGSNYKETFCLKAAKERKDSGGTG